jgi:hypothetical protein
VTRRLLPASLLFSLRLLCAPGSAAAAPVRFRVGNPRLFRTFTLPQYVDVG